MSKGIVTIQFVGRFGNQLFQYAFARSYAEQHGLELRTASWIGQKIFEINDPSIDNQLPVRAEVECEKWAGESGVEIRGYCMRQQSLTYTKDDARRWFRFRPEIQNLLNQIERHNVCAHLRHGDFVGLEGFVAVSKNSYYTACEKFQVPKQDLHFVSQETPLEIAECTQSQFGFLPDFYRLMRASILFRANSSFSWWAATLGYARRILAPDLTGIISRQVPVDVPFVEGNWPSISKQHSFCSDLHIAQ